MVALESTIVSHGMPWPHNFETALQLEADVRSEGCVPATIAVVDGRLKAGLARHEIERNAQYLTEQPYGVVLATVTGLPAFASVRAART